MEFMTVDEFAKKIKLCAYTVRKLIREGKINAIKPGKRTYRIPESELERFHVMSMFKEDKC